ncbi:MFS general substrate transporter [Lepidopterella palustris CBS 459.81]|uniref:MFS general substrate transporter n=1 Tax=Lepidopterella palustris CBS 459.81 TaxID=1314670 RepID=A0A8E2EFI6_9PEZI|nr:MFS general substrate transporter [Lepidopterella palustris CBS 459.81]
MADQPRNGITKTASGRTTYNPDGIAPPQNSFQSPRANDRDITPIIADLEKDDRSIADDNDSLAEDEDKDKDKELMRSTSSSTIATTPSARSRANHIITPAGDDELALSHPRTPPHQHRQSGVTPLGVTAVVDEEEISRERDLEKQESIKSKSEQKDPYLVEWDGPDDPGNPMNWPRWKKWMITIVFGSMTLCVTFASSVFSTATIPTSIKFGVSTEVMTLGTSLFVLGFAIGPPIFGPMSELYGRKIPLFIGFFSFAIFQIPVAVAQNLQTIMICRFFGGVFGSAPLAIVAGALTDFWEPVDRGIAVAVFAAATFIGPVAGPVAGGFVTQSYLGWRWTEYLTAIMAFSFGLLGFLVVPESYHPTLLQRRAKKLRHATRNWAIHAKADETQVDLKSIANKYLVRPFIMLALEPILLLVTLYIALIYGIIYLFFEAYPIAFQEHRHWSAGVGALPFIGIALGVLTGCGVIVWTSKTRFARKMKKHGRVVPEERLPPMILGGFLFPAGMFWFAWTSDPGISWVPQVISGVPIGMGIMLIFLQGLNYIIDCYLMNANSAVAANTFIRSFFGAGFPMFAAQMFHNLGVPWAASLLGFLTAALFPVPILFYFYGARIRKMSRYSPTF